MQLRQLAPLFLLSLAGTSYAQSKLYPNTFDLQEVTLGESPLQKAAERNYQTLLAYDQDRILTPFIREAGLAADKNSTYYGWTTAHPSFTNWALSSWSLEGHIGGHYLTALSLAYASCHDASMRAALKERLDYCLNILYDCQQAYANNTEGMKGFLGGQPIGNVWRDLYKGSTSLFNQKGSWVPFYCQHKILAGLRDAYVYAGSEKAYTMFLALADWSANIVANLDETQMQAVLSYEHGGMNEVLADAYALSGEQKYLTAARRYCHQYEVNGMQNGYSSTFLDGQHANTQVPKFIGFKRLAELDPSLSSYNTAAHNFFKDVAEQRTVAIGGNSVDEHFLAASASQNYINNLNGPETCNTNNMLKLSERLFAETADATYADFYEAAMYNHILSTEDPDTGGYVYFTTLRPQGYRVYSTVNQAMWCCVGTGMENHSKYGHFIYTHQGTDTLSVNLFVASTLAADAFGVVQETQFPYTPSTHLTLTKGGHYTLGIRHPHWVGQGFAVSVNGAAVSTTCTAGVSSYVYLTRDWTAGDVVTVDLPMSLRVEALPHHTDYIAFKYGPILLAARTTAATAAEAKALGLTVETLPGQYADESRMGHAPGTVATTYEIAQSPLLIGERADVLTRITPQNLDSLYFTINAASEESKGGWTSLRLEPFYGIHHARYMCYWYNQTAEGYATSDMAKADAEAEALNARTLDAVGTGEQQSEAGHNAAYSDSSTSGYYNGETYRDAQKNGYVQYELTGLQADASLSILCRFSIADAGRKATLYVEGEKVASITIPSSLASAEASGFYNAEYLLPASLLTDADGALKTSLTVRLAADQGTVLPGLYYLRLLRANNETGTYQWKPSDWTTGDAWRVAASNITPDDAAGTLTVAAGTGANNVALMMNYSACDYTVSNLDKYLVVRGTNLKTTNGGSYLWWLNGCNKGSQVAPTEVRTLDNGEVLVAWDITTSNLNDNCTSSVYSFCEGMTVFGLTSTTGVSVISYIGFVSSVDAVAALPALSQPADSEKDNPIYDPSGKPLTEKPIKGVFIQNAKKMTYQ